MLRRIVVLPKGTSTTQSTLQRAANCASPETDVVVLDTVYDSMVEGHRSNEKVYERLRSRMLASGNKRAAKLAAALAKRGVKAVGKAVWAAQREQAVEECRRVAPIDLLVMTLFRGGRHGVSTGDWRLLATSAVPVLVVKKPGSAQYRNIVAAVDPFHSHAKPAELDKKILSTAAALQAQTGAKLTVLHCFTAPEYFRADARLAPRDDDFEARRRTAVGKLLTAARLPASAARVVRGAPHEVLDTMVAGGEADVVVMGVLARGRLKDWLIGSTAERVLRRTRVDVLAVNPSP